MPTPRSVAPPSIIRPRRADATRGDRDKSKPAKVPVEQRATAKFTPTTTKCESSIGDSTAISRQFAPSSPCSQGSTSSRSGSRPLSAISFQRRSTRQTSRRSSFIVLVCLAGYPRNDRLPEERLNLCKWSRTGAAGCIPAGPEHCRAASPETAPPREGPKVRIHLPPARSQVQTSLPGADGHVEDGKVENRDETHGRNSRTKLTDETMGGAEKRGLRQ